MFKSTIKKYNMSINGILHIGAHFGLEIPTYKECGIPNIMMFEPVSHTFEVLKKNAPSDIILVNKALGNENKQIEMNITYDHNGQSSSILEPKLHLEQHPDIQFKHKMIVDMVRLDDVQFNRNDYNYINIDVQGYELEVFKGASETLNYIDYIMCEVNNAEVYKGCAIINQLDYYLTKYKFRRVETEWNGYWGDAIYIKNKD